MFEELIKAAGQSIVFGLAGIMLMAAGFLVVDLITPGKLREQIWTERNSNAALLLAANQLGIALIVFTAIFSSFDGLDWLTPGKLGDLIADKTPHPAAKVVAAGHFGAALIVCACIA
jgi:hypothetical protein